MDAKIRNLDARIRILERRIAAGDTDAIHALQQIWIRLLLVPSDDDLRLMRCGFVYGGVEAIPTAIRIWQHILSTLARTMNEYYKDQIFISYQLSAIVEHWSTEADSLEILYDTFFQVLGDADAHWTEGKLNYYLTHHPGVNFPPIYLHHNEITQSLRISYMNPHWEDPEYWDDEPWEDSRNRSPVKFDMTIRKIRDKWQVDLSWNVGDRFDDETAEYTAPTTIDDICLPFLLNLPCLLQEAPVWHDWGWGDCNLSVRKFGDWDYDPIISELGSMHWLVGPKPVKDYT